MALNLVIPDFSSNTIMRLTSVGQITIKFGTDFHVAYRVNSNDYGDPDYFFVTPPTRFCKVS